MRAELEHALPRAIAGAQRAPLFEEVDVHGRQPHRHDKAAALAAALEQQLVLAEQVDDAAGREAVLERDVAQQVLEQVVGGVALGEVVQHAQRGVVVEATAAIDPVDPLLRQALAVLRVREAVVGDRPHGVGEPQGGEVHHAAHGRNQHHPLGREDRERVAKRLREIQG